MSGIVADTLQIDGASGSATVAIAQFDSAKTVAANINAKSGSTGVTATAHTVVDAGNFGPVPLPQSISLSVISNNATAVTVAFEVTANTVDGLANGINAFNDKSSQTGVTAKMNAAGNGITLTNDTGQDISFVNNSLTGTFELPSSPAPMTVAAAAGTAYVTGAITVDSDKTFSLGSPLGVADTGVSFFNGAAASSQLQAADTLDVSTVESATRTLSTADSALSVISSQRAKFGALQSRFETTIANLQTTSENISASRSRIMDADFAMETANLSRAQILQQAGTAMVAQANQLPQGVLALLRQ